MIKYVEGNLISLGLEGIFDVIIQGCNCFCRMSNGLAKEWRKRLPGAWAADQATRVGQKSKLGAYTSANIFDAKKPLTAINAYTQYTYDRQSKPFDYEAFKAVCGRIKEDFAGKKIGFPKIGAGLAGGDWNEIEKIIEEVLGEEDITIVEFKP